MGLLRIIIWALIFYIVYKTVRAVMKIISESKRSANLFQSKKTKQSKLKIDKEDIIDAHFEEIDSSKEETKEKT